MKNNLMDEWQHPLNILIDMIDVPALLTLFNHLSVTYFAMEMK